MFRNGQYTGLGNRRGVKMRLRIFGHHHDGVLSDSRFLRDQAYPSLNERSSIYRTMLDGVLTKT